MKTVIGNTQQTREKRASDCQFTQRLIVVFFMVSIAFFAAGAVSHEAWGGLFDAMYPQTPSAADLAWQSRADVMVISPLVNMAMYVVPWFFYAAGFGAFVVCVLITVVDAADDLLHKFRHRGCQHDKK